MNFITCNYVSINCSLKKEEEEHPSSSDSQNQNDRRVIGRDWHLGDWIMTHLDGCLSEPNYLKHGNGTE